MPTKEVMQMVMTSKALVSTKSIAGYQLTGSDGFPFSKNTITLGSKGSVVAPCTLESNVVELHKFLYDNDEYVPSATVLAHSKQIESDTGYGEDDGYRGW